MRITFRQLQLFLAVHQYGSTAAAAQSISLSQSATSAAINELESMLNVQLFDRIGKRLIINENGRQLIPQVRQVLDGVRTIEDHFQSNNDHIQLTIHIGASTTIGNYLLPRILGKYMLPHLYPQIEIANSASIAALVANYEIDFGLIEGPCHEADLLVEKWFDDELIIVAGLNHCLVKNNPQKKITIKQLSQAKWLLRENSSGTREAVDQLLIQHLHYLAPAGEFSNSEAIKHATVAGLGIACLSRYVVADLLQSKQLIELKTPLPKLTRNLYLIQHQKKNLSTSSKNFLDFCKNLKGPL
jgi:DNA-binding transcriptional LysR family regulator